MDRLHNKTALVVDSSEIHRIVFRELLQCDINILESDSIDSAARIIKSGATVDIVLLDMIFPKKSGFDFLAFMQKNHYTENIPVIVVSSEVNESFVDRAFRLGAIDYINRPFPLRLLVRRVMTTILLYDSKKELAQKIDRRYMPIQQEVDELTGLFVKNAFYERAYQFLYRHIGTAFCMIIIDIGHFRLFNQFYGRETGDSYLLHVAGFLKRYSRRYGGVVGYGGADIFFYLCPDDGEIFERIETLTRRELRIRRLEIGFAPKFGVYRIEDDDKTIMDICDCAMTALTHIKNEYSNLISWYSPSMEKKDDEFKLLRGIEDGLMRGEFTFYLQPKCNMLTRKVIGSEALVRWIKTDGTIVSPGLFIPVLEKNGFISKLDCVIWESVCAWQRHSIDVGIPTLPISVNVSRTDFFNMDVSAFFSELIKKYDIPINLVELEITENAYAGKTKNLTTEISKLKRAGFTILMDDFGSGYSSLNSLKEMDIDVLKIDMKFLKLDYSTMQKGVSILESIVNMAASLDMPTIIEGVETAEQAQLLTDMGCIYAQGYYYYKPMKKEDFEKILLNPKRIDKDGIKLPESSSVHIMDLSEEKHFSDEMFNNILGAVAFYELTGDTIRLVKLNNQYYKMMGMKELVNDPEYAIHLRKSIHPGDRELFFNLFSEADKNPYNGVSAELRYIRNDNSIKWVRIRLFPLKKSKDSKLYYASLEDISDMYSYSRQTG